MIFEISALVLILGLTVFRNGFLGFFAFAPRVTICNVFQHIKHCTNTVGPAKVLNRSKAPRGKRRTRRTKPKKSNCHGKLRQKKAKGEEAINSADAVTRSKPDNLDTISGNTHSESSTVKKETEYDAQARNRVLYSSENAKESFTFKLDEFGGVVEVPYLKLLFLYKAVLREIEITVTPSYVWKDERDDKLRMTPEIYFSSKDEMKFLRPVEVQLETHYSATKKKEPIAVEIERTEHCVPTNWSKIRDVDFRRGMIKFWLNQFCGIRAVCQSCRRSIMSSRISYNVSVRDSANANETERYFYLRVYTDTPDQHEQVLQEIERDDYRRIHPTQKYTVREGFDVICHVFSHGLHSTPQFVIVKMEDEIIMEAILFKLQTLHGSQITTSDLSIKTDIGEITSVKTTHMSYSDEPATACLRSVNFTISGGSMIQANVCTGQVTQQNTAPPVAALNVGSVPNDVGLTPPSGQTIFANNTQSATINGPAIALHGSSPASPSRAGPNELGACYLNSSDETIPKEVCQSELRRSSVPSQVLVNGQPTFSPEAATNPKELYLQSAALSATNFPVQGSQPGSMPGFAVGNQQSQVSVPQRAFTVTQVQETEPKAPWGLQDPYARFRQSTPSGLQSQQSLNPAFGSVSTLRSVSSLSIPEAVSYRAGLVPTDGSHPGYTQTIGRGDLWRLNKPSHRSAFCRLVRNSSHPSLSSFDFRPLTLNLVEAKEEEAKDKQGLLFAVPEGQTVPRRQNPSPYFNAEVSEALENAEASSITDDQAGVTKITEAQPLHGSQNSRPYPDRPSAVSSGFVSGVTTRNTSACNDAINNGLEPSEKSKISPTISERGAEEYKLHRQRRPRSVSDPRELAARLDKLREQAGKTNQFTQTGPRTYSEVLKMSSIEKPGMHQTRKGRRPSGIPRPCNVQGQKGNYRRRVKKV